MNIKQQKKAFTLVELIVVIVILAILWTIAVISLKWYSAAARDSKRISDIQNIKKSLELFSLNTWKYPFPDNLFDTTFSWKTVRKQWYVWDNITTNLSRNLNKKPVDPTTENEYVYSVTINQTEYEVLWVYENVNTLWYNSFLTKTNAVNQYLPKIDWNYNWVAIKMKDYIIPTPSIINTQFPVNNELVLNSSSIKSQVTTWWENILNWLKTTTGWLDLDVFLVYEIPENWEIDKNELSTLIKNTYNSSVKLNEWIYSEIKNSTTDDEMIDILDKTVLNSKISNDYISKNNILVYSDCSAWTLTWELNSNLIYTYWEILHWNTWTWLTTENITGWTKDYIVNLHCNNWELRIINEIAWNINCNTSEFYQLVWENCIREIYPNDTLFNNDVSFGKPCVWWQWVSSSNWHVTHYISWAWNNNWANPVYIKYNYTEPVSFTNVIFFWTTNDRSRWIQWAVEVSDDWSNWNRVWYNNTYKNTVSKNFSINYNWSHKYWRVGFLKSARNGSTSCWVWQFYLWVLIY